MLQQRAKNETILYKCVHCDRDFTRNSNLSRHLRIHLGDKRFQCPECPQTFMEKHHLTSHVRTHNGERPFVCRVKDCQKSFMHQSNMLRHQRMHHKPKDPLPDIMQPLPDAVPSPTHMDNKRKPITSGQSSDKRRRIEQVTDSADLVPASPSVVSFNHMSNGEQSVANMRLWNETIHNAMVVASYQQFKFNLFDHSIAFNCMTSAQQLMVLKYHLLQSHPFMMSPMSLMSPVSLQPPLQSSSLTS